MISNSITGVDTTGPITKRINITNEKDLPTSKMISIIGKKDDREIDEYFTEKRKRPTEEHKSMLDEFQL